MTEHGDLRVSSRGQMSLPAAARHRWLLDEGGTVGFIDIGDAVVLIPGRAEELRDQLLAEITESTWAEARSGFGDPDLATE